MSEPWVPPPFAPRHDWTLEEVRHLHDLPLFDLTYRAQGTHRAVHAASGVQLCSLLSIKTGGCSEDCGYCSQSARHPTAVEAQPMSTVEAVLTRAARAKEAGATRFCLGAAWREVRDGSAFDAVLEMVRGVRALGLEACCTLGSVTAAQAERLAEAGLTAYNHNLDTSREFYGAVVSTHTYDERLATLGRLRDAGIHLCTGGIIGMGESVDDRCMLLVGLAELSPHPESVPVNALVPVEGTPFGRRPFVETVELVRFIATARIMMPRARIRLAAGRAAMSQEAQLLCLLAGANSIFLGDRLLTTENPTHRHDFELLAAAGLEPQRLGLGSAVRP